MDNRQLKSINVLNDLQSEQRRKLIKECMRLSSSTLGRRSMTFAAFETTKRDTPAVFWRMRWIAAKFLLRLLTDDQKQHRLEICVELESQVRKDSLPFQYVSGDQSWVYGYEAETKQRSSQWKSPSSHRQKKMYHVKNNVKSMLICFFDIDGIIDKEFVSLGATVSAKFYCDIVIYVNRSLKKRQMEMLEYLFLW